jgi:hypothetical protein
MDVNKHQALCDWLTTCPLLTDTPLVDFLNETQGSVAVVGVSQDLWVKRFIRNTGQKAYTFELQVMLRVSDTTDYVNAQNRYLVDTWAAWLDERQTAGDFPDFGGHCGDYSIENLSNFASLAQRYESGYGKYTLTARVNYYQK